NVRIHQIAEHVGEKYRLADGRQLDAVIASHPRLQNLPVSAIAIRPRQTDVNQGIAITRGDRSWAFNLCGLAKDCSIDSSTPGEPRGRLLRREALELALYTFKYVPASETVVTFLPPAGGSGLYALLRLDEAGGDAAERLVRAHHRRRLGALGAHALDPPAGLWATGEPPPRAGCALDVLIDGEEALPRIAEELRRAESHVHLAGW